MPRNALAVLLLFSLGMTTTLTALTTKPARAAPAWVSRDIVLPRGDVALDLGLGWGHVPAGPDSSITGFGLNLEVAGGIASAVELGLRVGLRLDDGGQVTQADRYGRPFQTETYGTRFDRVSNPEAHARWSVSRTSTFELATELRAYLPTEQGSRLGFMLGVPLVLRGGALRIDTGLYVPVILYDPTRTVVSVPIHLWIQATRTLWLGPLFGIRVINDSGSGNATEYPLGFGVGSALNSSIDLRTWLLFPNLNGHEAARTFGVGLALQLRIE
jgi:hypothetical protein